MLNPYVFRYGVAAPGAAAQSQGRSQLEIVKVAYAALRGRSINQYTAGLHALGELLKLFLLGNDIQIDRGSMAVAAVGYELLRLIQSVVKILGFIHSQHRAKLFMSKFFA